MERADLDKITLLAAQLLKCRVLLLLTSQGSWSISGLEEENADFVESVVLPALKHFKADHPQTRVIPFKSLGLNRVDSAFASKAELHVALEVPLQLPAESGQQAALFIFDRTQPEISVAQQEAINNLAHLFAALSGRPGKNSTSGTKRLLERKFTSLSYSYKAFLNGTDYGVMLMDTRGAIKVFNVGAEKMLGYTQEEVIDRHSVLCFHFAQELTDRMGVPAAGGDAERFASYVQIPASGHTHVADWTFVRKTGDTILVQLSVSAVRNEQKEIIGYLAVAEDITEKRRIQEALRLSEEKHRFFFENSQGLMFSHNLDGEILSVNGAGAAILGYEVSHLLGKTIQTFAPARWAQKIQDYLTGIAKQEEASGLMRLRHRDGSSRVFYYKNVKIGTAATAYVIGNAIDVSSRIEMENELKRAKLFAERANHAKDQFLANMSHEIRTPMNAIIGFNNLLDGTALDESQRECVDAIRIAGENLMGIINDILDFSKIQSGKLVLERTTFNLPDTINNACNILRVKAAEKGVVLTLSISGNIPVFVVSDPLRLNQVLVNLIGNAIKFTDRGTVSVSVDALFDEPTTCRIRFSVSDTGIGISPEQAETIFERFTQASSDTTRRYGGTGLGLSISRNLVEMLGGRLVLKSQLGSGSEFSFELSMEKSKGPVDSRQNERHGNGLPGAGRCILLVEDNELNQKLAKKVLNGHGYEVDLAENGQEGLKLLGQKNYDVVLMDLQMPVMDGYQATRAIREKLKLNVPVIAMTAHSLVGEKEKCLQIGMNDYIAKPFKTQDLLNLLNQYIRADRPIPQTDTDTPNKSQVNIARLEELSGGNSQFEREIIELFIEKAGEDRALITEALQKGKLEAAKHLCHKLRSGVLTFGLEDLAGMLAAIEYKHNSAGEALRDWQKAEPAIVSATQELTKILKTRYTG